MQTDQLFIFKTKKITIMTVSLKIVPNITIGVFCVCYLHMQMQTLCRAVEISITTSYSTGVKMFYRGLTKVFIVSPFCEEVHGGQVKRNHLS